MDEQKKMKRPKWMSKKVAPPLRPLSISRMTIFRPTLPQIFTPLELMYRDVPHTVGKVRFSAFQRYAARFRTSKSKASGSANVRALRTTIRSITFFFLRIPTNIAYTRKLVYKNLLPILFETF